MNCGNGQPKIKWCFGNGVGPFSLFYGVVIGLLIFAATSTMRHNERVQPGSVTAFTGQTNAALPVMHRSHWVFQFVIRASANGWGKTQSTIVPQLAHVAERHRRLVIIDPAICEHRPQLRSGRRYYISF
jgi:hypothetical protein